MKLLNFIKTLFLLTILALIYIHMQMRIFDLAYQCKQNERHLTDLQETNGVITGDIQRMKSADYLGTHLLSEDSRLTFFDNNNVIQVVRAEPSAPRPQDNVLSTMKQQRANTFLSFISSRFAPEARAEEK